MRVYYVGDDLSKLGLCEGIFLAGPTPRDVVVQSWRPSALTILEKLGYDGSVFVPETADWGWLGDYDAQVHWEWRALARCKAALFWVPRDLETMPAFTTNVEFGFMMGLRPSSVVLGAPAGTPKMRYLRSMVSDAQGFHRYFDHHSTDVFPVWGDNLQTCLERTVEKVNDR